jgi:hypothetical protein
MTVLNSTSTLNTDRPLFAITRATSVMIVPTPSVAAHPTARLSDFPAHRGTRAGRMSLEMMLACTLSRPEMLDIVALNIAASMMPTSPEGRSVSAASA